MRLRRAPAPIAVPIALTILVAAASCNEHPLTPLGETLFVTSVEVSPRLKSNAVDILWVVDNSPSMREEQVELGARFTEFVDALSDLQADFRMAVITTDLNDGGRFQTSPGPVQTLNCFEPPESLAYCEGLSLERPFLRAQDYMVSASDPAAGLRTTELAADFRCIASAGDCGNGFERGLEVLRNALSPEMLQTSNANFIRDEAFLVVIFLTDEDDCSNNDAFQITRDADCYASEQRGKLVPVQEYYDFLVDLKNGEEEKILLAGLIGPDDGLPPQTFQELDRNGPRFSCISELSTSDSAVDARDGERYRELITLAGSRGLEESICQANFSTALTNIGEILREALDVNCLAKRPRTCEVDADCPGGVQCIQPGDANVGDKFCENFEIFVEVQQPGASNFEPLASPGAVGEPEAEGAQFLVDYDASVCLHGVAFSFVSGSRPPTGARYRVSYPQEIDLITAGVDESEDDQPGSVAEP